MVSNLAQVYQSTACTVRIQRSSSLRPRRLVALAHIVNSAQRDRRMGPLLPTKNGLSNVVALTKVLASFDFLPLKLLPLEFRPLDLGLLVFAVVLSVMRIPVHHVVVVWLISN